MKDLDDVINKPFAIRLIALQAVVALTISLFSLLISQPAAQASLIGGFIAVLGNAYFARSIFKSTGNKPPKRILVSYYASEVSKLALVFMLFFLAFKTQDYLEEAKNALMMFISFAAVQAVSALTPLLIKNKTN
jgi:ATP synthase protein I